MDLTECPTKQVLLEVKITEASRNFTRTLESKLSLGKNSANFIESALGLKNLADTSAGVFNNTVGQYIFSSSSSDIAWMLTAAEQQGACKNSC